MLSVNFNPKDKESQKLELPRIKADGLTHKFQAEHSLIEKTSPHIFKSPKLSHICLVMSPLSHLACHEDENDSAVT